MSFPRDVQTLALIGNKTNWYVEMQGGTVKSFLPDTDFWTMFLNNHEGTKFEIFERFAPETIRPLAFDIKLKFDPDSDLSGADDMYIGVFKNTMKQLHNIVTYGNHKPSSKYPENYVCLATTSPMIKNGLLHARLTLPYMRIDGNMLMQFYNGLAANLDFSELGKNIEPAPLGRISKMLIPLKEKSYLIGSQSAPFTEFKYFNMSTSSDVNEHEVFKKGQFEDLHLDVLDHNLQFAPLLSTSKFCHEHVTEFLADDIDDLEHKDDDNEQEIESIESYNYRKKRDQISMFLNLVSDKRADIYYDWVDIGAAISHLSTFFKYSDIKQAIDIDFDYTRDGLELWKEFTARGTKFTAQDCEDKWCEISDDLAVVTANTIEFFAMKDSPVMYSKIMAKPREDAIKAAINNPTHLNVANVFKLMYPYQYACTGTGKKDRWYYFQGVHWESRGTEKITQAFLGAFRDIFLNRQRDTMKSRDKAHVIGDQKQVMICEDELKKINTLLNKTGDNAYINKLIKIMASMYFTENFSKFQDSLLHVTAFRNCVIDIRSGRAEPREGKPEDYCTKFSSCNYKKLHHQHPDVLAIKKYMREVFRNKDRRNFMYRFIASMFVAANSDKVVPIWQGIGDNSKSVLIRLLNLAFGSYVDKISTSVLTEKRTASDAATPALIRAKGKRLIVAQEPDKNDPIRSGTMKEFSGGDTMAGRELYQDGGDCETITPTFILGLMTNHALHMLNADQAVWNRVILVAFTSRWVKPENCPPDYELQVKQGKFPIDTNFDRNFPQMARGLIWLAGEYFADYAKNGLQIPECVMADSHKQRCDNNTFIAFASDNIEIVEVDEDKYTVHTSDMYELYRTWFKDQGHYVRPPTKREFVESLSTTLERNPIRDEWHGIRTITRNPYAAFM